MVKKTPVPDAWEDDWEAQADRAAKEEAENPTPAPVLTKAERLAEHAESNRRLWQSAEANETFHFIEASNPIPLAAAFKPQVKVLSRKPVIAKRGDASTALGQLSLGDNDDDDCDDAKKQAPLSLEEVRAKQKRDREEKQRKYDEARAKIFGESASSSRGSSPGNGTTTPPRSSPSLGPQQQYQSNSRTRGRGGGGGGGGGRGGPTILATTEHSRGPSDSRRGPTQSSSGRLYDPNYAPKPDSGAQRRDDAASHSNARAQNRDRDLGVPIRAPRGPDGSGRGGFGFARRGTKEG